MLTSSSFHIFFPAALLVLSVVGCSTLPAPSLVPAQVTNPERIEEVQPPTLPIEPAITPLPRIGGSVPVAVDTLFPAAVTTSRVQMRLLLVSPTAADPGLAALEALCDQVGVPCERFVGAVSLSARSRSAFTPSQLFYSFFCGQDLRLEPAFSLRRKSFRSAAKMAIGCHLVRWLMRG